MQMTKLIYAADDEANIRQLVAFFLEREGHRVETFATGDNLMAAFLRAPADLVILDIMMPGRDGLEICTALRQISKVPIILLTARDTDADYIAGITLGSDDYFKKPFSPMLLVMRVKALFRRIEYEQRQPAGEEMLTMGGVTISTLTKSVTCGPETLNLTPNEYSLLHYLMTNRHRAVSRAELLDKIWGIDCEIETRVADDTVKRLRKKILTSHLRLDTIWGFGFHLKENGP
jgi:DNA-binding response OmpR family regulator